MSQQIDIYEQNIYVDIIEDTVSVNINDQITIAKGGLKVGNTRFLDFLPGNNVTLDVVQQGSKIKITINSSGGGGGGSTTDAYILAILLAGLSTASTSDVTAADSILSAIGKLQANKARTFFKDGSQAMEADIDVNGHNIKQLAAATANGEAVNFEQLNAAIDGLKPKDDCVAATTVNITLFDEQTVDGIGVVDGNRVLVKDQLNPTQNGIYIVAVGDNWIRTADSDTAIELQGAFVQITSGTINASTSWIQYSVDITIGSTDLLWRQLSSTTPDATPTTKGKAKLYSSTALGTNTDGAPDQNAVKVYVDNAVAGATIADASPTVKGKAKLYTSLGTNTDGAIDQATAKANFDLKAPLASPALTGTPTAPTAAPGTNTTQLATTAFIKAAIDALVNAAPGALDTLKELADALGDDPNFATTITALIALKEALANKETGSSLTDDTTKYPSSHTTKTYVDNVVSFNNAGNKLYLFNAY